MPILKNAKKAFRSSKRKSIINAQIKTQMRTSIKTAKTNPSQATISVAFSRIDRSVKKRVIHKNKAARLKSQMSRLLSLDMLKSNQKKTITSESQPTKSKSKPVLV